VLLGFNNQIQRPFGPHPFVFSGVVGPLPVPDTLQRDVGAAARRLAAVYHLRGLGSIDFLQDGDRAEVLEVNPRPTASAALYRRVGAGGPMRAHLRACLHGELPPAPAPQQPVRGCETLFARRPLRLGARAAARLGALADVHDLPREGTRFAVGSPLCSISASGREAEQVHDELAARRDTLLKELEDLS
jgi:predicted ATP-grasp superfamily ATP-dependent carboligase